MKSELYQKSILILPLAFFLVLTNSHLVLGQAPKNMAIYASKRVPISFKQVQEIVGEAKLKVIEGSEEDWSMLEVKWNGGVSVKLGRNSIAEDETLVGHLGGFAGFVYQRLAQGKMDGHVFEVIRQINKTNHLYSVQADPDISSGNVKNLAQKLASSERAIIFISAEVLDPELKVLLGPESAHDKASKFPGFDSAVARKERTMKLLTEKKLNCYDGLPLVVADEQVRLREAQNVARRAICLIALASEAEVEGDFDAKEFLTKHKLMDSLSQKEKAFLANKKRTAKQNSDMTWRYEAVWSLLWSLGKVDEFGFPDKQSDAKISIKVVMDDPAGLIQNAKLRPTSEILDKADLLYRCMWICREAQRNGKTSEGLSMSIVYERLYALNWLIRHGNAAWDKVQTDS